MKSKEVARVGLSPPLILEETEYVFHDLITIKSNPKYKREIVEKIRTNLASWMSNSHFDKIRSELLDIAIVVRVRPERMRIQDIDNIAKVILDALKKSESDSRFLFNDDNQIVRLLLYKEQSKELPGYKTDSITISCRVYNPETQMILTTTAVL